MNAANVGESLMGILAGLRNGLAPMLGKEMRFRTRGWRSPLILTAYLGLVSAGTVAFIWLGLDCSGLITPQTGLALYGLMVLGLVLLLAFIAPAVTASTISGEKERKTYDLMLVTKASLTGIVLGKWLAALVYLLFLVIAALPVLAVVYFFGGVPVKELAMTVLVCMLTGLGYGAMGIALSAVLRRSQVAIIVSLVLVFVLVFGSLVVAGIVAETASRADYPIDRAEQLPGVPWYVFLSPITALADATPGGGDVRLGRGVPLVSSLINELMRSFQPAHMQEYAIKYGYTAGGLAQGEAGGASGWPFWARFAVTQGVLAFLSLTVAVVAIAPRKPWHAWRARRLARKKSN